MSITIQPLPYVEYEIAGGLVPIYIGPAENNQGVIESGTIFVNAALPDLGTPAKKAPGVPVGGPGGGQYIEIIVDDSASSSRVTTMVPYAMQLDEGTHMLHFMLSAGDGECVKNGGNVISKVVHIRSKSDFALSDSGPIIIYNLPRAVHRVDNVIIDFGLVNCALGTPPTGTPIGMQWILDYRVNIYIDNVLCDVVDYWNPYKVTGLNYGTHTVKLELRRRAGNPTVSDPYAITNSRAFDVVPSVA